MIEQVNLIIGNIEGHLENIDELLPGIPDENAEDFLSHLQNAEINLEEAYGFLKDDEEILGDQLVLDDE